MTIINIKKIASMAGVSPTTVSRVLNDSPLVKESTVNKVKRVIEEIGYRPNELARGLRIKETKTIGVIVSNILNPFFTSIVRGIEDVANQFDYSIILCNTDEEPSKEERYINMLTGKQVDGLIIASTGGNYDFTVNIANLPTVFVDRKPDSLGDIVYDTVLVKNVEGSYMATKYLINQGYKRIGIITGSTRSHTGKERLKGYKQAIKECGIKLDSNLIKISDFLGHSGYKSAIELLMQTDCDALFVANNLLLVEVLKAARELGITFLRDKGLAVFDDIDWMEYCESKIISVSQPTYEIGTTAMKLLLDRLAGSKCESREIMLDVKLVPR